MSNLHNISLYARTVLVVMIIISVSSLWTGNLWASHTLGGGAPPVLFGSGDFSDNIPDSVEHTPTGALIQSTAGDGEWAVTVYEPPPNFVFISLDGLLIPIDLTEERVISAENESGSFIFEGDTFSSAVANRVDTYSLPEEVTFSYRPTLFVSLSGFQPEIESVELDPSTVISVEGAKDSEWQYELDKQLVQEFANNGNYQYQHFLVRWENQKSVRKQSAVLASKIRRFLADRKASWDVVLIGHSRGGIMVNRVSQYLAGNGKIKRLHSYLLDPTASPNLGDTYPTSLPEGKSVQSFGTLYYDEKGTIGGDKINFNTGAIFSDFDIRGYRTVKMLDSKHSTIHMDWIQAPSEGLQQAFEFALSKKTTDSQNSFAVDGNIGLTIIEVQADRGFAFYGEAGCDSDGCYVVGEITADGFSVAYAEGRVDGEGLDFAYGALSITTARAVIRNDQLVLAQTLSVPGSDVLQIAMIQTLDSSGYAGQIQFVGVRAGASVTTEDISVNVNIVGVIAVEAEVSTGGTIVGAIGGGSIGSVIGGGWWRSSSSSKSKSNAPSVTTRNVLGKAQKPLTYPCREVGCVINTSR